jgi:Helix-turn-helix domain
VAGCIQHPNHWMNSEGIAPILEGNNVQQHAEPKTIVSDSGPTFMLIPLVLARNSELSGNAKLLYSRLMLFSGKDGSCFPSQETLGSEIGLSGRHVQTILAELRACGLVSWHRRRTSSSYVVHPPESFISQVQHTSSDHEKKTSSDHVQHTSSDKKMSLNRGLVKDVALACSPRTQRAVDISQTPPRKVQEYPKLRKILAQFMANMQALRPEHYPKHQQVAELVHACEVEGLGESWIQKELVFLYNVKGVRYGVTNGPYSFKWFISTLSGRASEEIERRDARSESVWDHDGIRMVN